MKPLSLTFVEFAISNNVLKFGSFITKANRTSPYFFNTGSFYEGASLFELCDFYAKTIIASNPNFDILFGPAYKGITLAAGTSISLAHHGYNCSFAFNRKEIKDHGEGGLIVGAPLHGNVMIIDDVISAGTSVHESIRIIKSAGANPVGIVIAIDRMERGTTALSATKEVEQKYGIPVFAIATLEDIKRFLADSPNHKATLQAITEYHAQYGMTLT